MGLNQNAWYGQAQVCNAPYTTGRLFVVADSSDANIQDIQELYVNHYDGVSAIHATPTLALAQCVASRGDVVILSPWYTTALSASELLSAETKGVTITKAGSNPSGIQTVQRATAALPQTTDEAIFTVSGRVKLISIVGEVTTAIQNQANNTKIKINPTVGADVDLCAVLDIDNDAVGTNYTITGTLANAMVEITSGSWVYQASPLIVTAWDIELDCAASNTGSVKRSVTYEAIDPGATIVAA